VNHTQIAAAALRYRCRLVQGALIELTGAEIEAMAVATVVAADPAVDSAIRQIATAWLKSGLSLDGLCKPWACAATDELFGSNPELIDALDEILKVATRALAA